MIALPAPDKSGQQPPNAHQFKLFRLTLTRLPTEQCGNGSSKKIVHEEFPGQAGAWGNETISHAVWRRAGCPRLRGPGILPGFARAHAFSPNTSFSVLGQNVGARARRSQRLVSDGLKNALPEELPCHAAGMAIAGRRERADATHNGRRSQRFRGSSVAERSASDRVGAGSNPAPGPFPQVTA